MEFIVVGLGNPGKEYDHTRHNVGFSVIDILCSRLGVSLGKETPSSMGTSAVLGGHKVLLARPTTYMNDSGIGVGEILRRYKTEPEQLIVIQDELDLEFGSVRIKKVGDLPGTTDYARSINTSNPPTSFAYELVLINHRTKHKAQATFSNPCRAKNATSSTLRANAQPMLSRK